MINFKNKEVLIMSLNKVILMGRLTRNPDIRYSQGEKPVCIARYTLAVDRRFRREGEQEADFIGCVAFGRQGEFAEKYLQKGTKIVICGRIQTGSYTDKEGKTRYTTDIVVEEQNFAESKAASQQHTGQQPAQPQAGAPNTASAAMPPQQNGYAQQPTQAPTGYPNPANAAMPPQQNGYTQQPYGQPPVSDGFMTIPEGIEDELPFI